MTPRKAPGRTDPGALQDALVGVGKAQDTTPVQCRCGAPAVRKLVRVGYCSTHLAELYSTFNPAVFAFNGKGLQTGRVRPEYGPLVADLTCCNSACGATWSGVPGDPCPWCQRSREALEDHQRSLLLRFTAQPTEANVIAWGERLRRAVDTGLITRDEARGAWRKAVRHGLAA